jgi:predicted RNA-binding protein with PUA-like domain
MPTFLLKSEPGDYSYDDLARDKRTPWDGVTAPAACMHLRAMRKGDEAFIYHTGGERAVVGLASVVSDPYADPDREPTHTAAGELRYPVVDVRPRKRASSPMTLADFKADERFGGFDLLRQSRLSVMPIPEDAWRKICVMGETDPD